MSEDLVPRSLVWATNIDVLAPDRVVERRDDHLVVRSPSNPEFHWGNFLLFDDPPGPGDRGRWEAAFDEAFGDEPRVRHRLFGWDDVDGEIGAAREELEAHGYLLEDEVGLVGGAEELAPHPRESRAVEVVALDPDGDEELWEAMLEVQVAGRDSAFEEEAYRVFRRGRNAGLRDLFRTGRGTWYAAVDPPTGEVAGSLGIVVTAGRGRYQAVDTAEAHRGRGVASRLVVEAARHAAATFGAEWFVIAADPHYHALGIYESLGFRRREQLATAVLRPPSA